MSRIKCGFANRCILCRFCDAFSAVCDGFFAAGDVFSVSGGVLFAVRDGLFVTDGAFLVVCDGFSVLGAVVFAVCDVLCEGDLVFALLLDVLFLGLGVGCFCCIFSFFGALWYCTVITQVFVVLLENFRKILSPEETAFSEILPG